MKNIVKSCKRKRWIAWVSGVFVFIITNLVFDSIRVNILPALIAAIILSAICGIIIFGIVLQAIWLPTYKEKSEISQARELNNLYLIQKIINSGDKERSKVEINKYRAAKYCNRNSFMLFKGIYIGKFNEEINVVNN